MAQRKVLIKYFPKNFDPKLLVKRGRGKDKLMNVRNMLPMSLRCNVCGNYLYIGTKFNMRMEICNEETYLGIKVFRFYLKCTYCYNQICFKTDPKNHDYIVEDGGTRNYEPIKDAEQAQKLMKKLRKQQKQGNSMKFLQTKTYDSKRQMELMEALDDIKNLNKRNALIDPQDLLNNMFIQQQENQKFTEQQERQIDARFDELRKKKLGVLILNIENQNDLQKIAEQEDEELQQKVEEQQIIKKQIIQVLQRKDSNGNTNVNFNPRQNAIKRSSLFNVPAQKNQTIKPKTNLRKIKNIKKPIFDQKLTIKKLSHKQSQDD